MLWRTGAGPLPPAVLQICRHRPVSVHPVGVGRPGSRAIAGPGG